MVLSPTFSELDTLVKSSLVKNKDNHVVADGFSFHNHYSAWQKTYFSLFNEDYRNKGKTMVSKQTP